MTTRFGTLLQEELAPVLSRFLTAAGENAESGTQAAKVVLPVVLAGVLKSTAGNPDYAAALYRQAGAESGLSADEVQVQSERLIDLGNSLLPAVFDGNAADAAAELARQSGITKASAARLLAMALPLVLAHLGRSSGSLSDFLKLLAGQSDHLAENLNGGLLSALGISNVAAVSAVAHKLSSMPLPCNYRMTDCLPYRANRQLSEACRCCCWRPYWLSWHLKVAAPKWWNKVRTDLSRPTWFSRIPPPINLCPPSPCPTKRLPRRTGR